MNRSELRRRERIKKHDDVTQGLRGWRFVVMCIVTFAMVFSSIGYVLNYGNTNVAIAVVVLFMAVLAGLFIYSIRHFGD